MKMHRTILLVFMAVICMAVVGCRPGGEVKSNPYNETTEQSDITAERFQSHCTAPDENSKYYESFQEIQVSPEKSNGIRPKIDFVIVDDSNSKTGNQLVVSTYYFDSGFGGSGDFTIYSHNPKTHKVKALLVCDETPLFTGDWRNNTLHFTNSFKFTDVDNDGDYDLRYTNGWSSKERVWLNDNNTRWSTKPEMIWKMKPLPTLLYVSFLAAFCTVLALLIKKYKKLGTGPGFSVHN